MDNSQRQSTTVSERIYRALLVAYPKEFRREYGPQMVQLFRDTHKEELDGGRRGALIALWLRTLVELASTALRERSRIRVKRDLWMSVGLNFFGVAVFQIPLSGLGQLYNRQFFKGGLLLAASLVGWGVLLFGSTGGLLSGGLLSGVTLAGLGAMWLWSLWDAYRVARQINGSLEVGRSWN